MPLFEIIEYKELKIIDSDIKVRFQDAGHIMGSASIELFVTENNKQTKLVFSGDI
jgi:metallo-beta-lactamase family protein